VSGTLGQSRAGASTAQHTSWSCKVCGNVSPQARLYRDGTSQADSAMWLWYAAAMWENTYRTCVADVGKMNRLNSNSIQQEDS